MDIRQDHEKKEITITLDIKDITELTVKLKAFNQHFNLLVYEMNEVVRKREKYHNCINEYRTKEQYNRDMCTVLNSTCWNVISGAIYALYCENLPEDEETIPF